MLLQRRRGHYPKAADYLSPQSEYILDWFHITMRLTGTGQMRKGMASTEEAALAAAAEKDLDSLKWHLWNGNIDPALRLVDGLKTMLGGEGISAERQKLLGAVREFGNYIAANQACIPDYGDRYRSHAKDQHGIHRIGGQPAREPAHGQTATDALDRARSALVIAGSRSGDERRFTPDLQPLVSRDESSHGRTPSAGRLISNHSCDGFRWSAPVFEEIRGVVKLPGFGLPTPLWASRLDPASAREHTASAVIRLRSN